MVFFPEDLRLISRIQILQYFVKLSMFPTQQETKKCSYVVFFNFTFYACLSVWMRYLKSVVREAITLPLVLHVVGTPDEG